MLSAESAFVLFLMLGVSSVSLFIAQRIKVPHTVFLVAVGILLAILSTLPPFHFLGEFTLTPELLFFIFLPTLIFESAYNINIRHLTQDALVITILAIVSLVVSAFAIAFGVDFIFGLIGLDIPFILALVFGAIISATDPVAVLALFKEYGAPRRLSLIFEGESIFNDGTGVALFLVVLAIAESGVYGSTDIVHGAVSFIGMVIGGIIFGLIFGGFFAKLIGYTRSNEFASITLTMVLAHTTFICAELFSHNVTIGGQHILLSSIIATAVASLLMGNYGRYKMPIHAAEFVEKYWSQFAFLANSLIFILIGMLAIKLPASTPELMWPIFLSIIIVAAARALSIYPIVELFNIFSSKENQVPRAWQHVLAWGSLRGALAVTMVLMIPDTLSFPNWNFAYTPKEFILALTVGCVFATLFVKATTIGMIMQKLKLNTFTSVEEINYREMLVYIYSHTLTRLRESFEKGYITEDTYVRLHKEQQIRIHTIMTDLKSKAGDPMVLEKVIRLHAIGIERKYVRELYGSEEIKETTIKKIMAKLEYQSHAIEGNNLDALTYEHGATQDVFEYLAAGLKRLTGKKLSENEKVIEHYMYYRALAIISRKVVKELSRLTSCFEENYAGVHHAIQHTSSIYAEYQRGATAKMEELKHTHHALLSSLDYELAGRALYRRETSLLHNLTEREMVTPKVRIALEERFAHESRKTH